MPSPSAAARGLGAQAARRRRQRDGLPSVAAAVAALGLLARRLPDAPLPIPDPP
jgi:hypothetical protein